MKPLGKEARLLRLMLFFDTFSAEDLKTAVAMDADPTAPQTVHNTIDNLLHTGALEVVSTEPSGGGRHRRRFRVSINSESRVALYKEAYGTEQLEHAAPEEPIGETYQRALHMLDEAKVRFAPFTRKPLNPHMVAQGVAEFGRIIEFLEVAFYEQSPAARRGAIGTFLRDARRDAEEIQHTLRHNTEDQKSTEEGDQKRLFFMTAETTVKSLYDLVCNLVSRCVDVSKVNRQWVEEFAVFVDQSWTPDELTSLDKVRCAAGALAAVVPQPSQRLALGQWYNYYDLGPSFESTYHRTCVQLFAGDLERAKSEWRHVLTGHEQHRPVVERLKARSGKVIEPRPICHVGVVHTNQFMEAYPSLRESQLHGWTVEAVSLNDNDYVLPLARGESGIMKLFGSLPTGLSACQLGSQAIPLRESSASPAASQLFATPGIAPFLDVPGPAPLKLAVALEAVGIAGERSLSAALDVCNNQDIVVFLFPAHDRISDVQEPVAKDTLPIQWLSSSRRL